MRTASEGVLRVLFGVFLAVIAVALTFCTAPNGSPPSPC